MLNRICLYRCQQWHSVQVSWIVRTHCFKFKAVNSQNMSAPVIPCSFLFVNSKRDVEFHCSGSTRRSVHEVLTKFLAAGEKNHSLSQLMSLFVAMTIFKTCTAWDQEQKTSHLQLKAQDCYVNTLSQIQYSAIQDGINIPRVPPLCRFTSKNLGLRKG